MTWLLSLVGSPILRVVAGASVVILIFWLMIQYGKSIQEQEQIQEQLEGHIDTRERIDEAIRNTPIDTDGAIGVLDDFLDSR